MMTIDKTMIVVATNWQFWWYNQLICIGRSWPGQYLLASFSDKECNTPALHNIGKHWIVGVSQLEPNCGYYRKMLGPIKRKRLLSMWVHGGIAPLIKNILEKVEWWTCLKISKGRNGKSFRTRDIKRVGSSMWRQLRDLSGTPGGPDRTEPGSDLVGYVMYCWR